MARVKRIVIPAAKIGGEHGLNARVRTLVHQLGHRYLLDDERYPGVPHLVFPSKRLMIFTVWCEHLHSHEFRSPSSRSEHGRAAWELETILGVLRSRQWRCEAICGCDARTKRNLERRIRRIFKARRVTEGH
jgi:G:T-mismatch repair DNA endonuclease (very short patch repair protein)